MIQIRALAALALACAAALAVPARAQHDSAAVADVQSPASFGLQMVESLRAAGLEHPTGRFLLFVDGGGARVSFHGSNVADSLQAVVLPLVNRYVASRGTAEPFHLSIQLDGMVRRPPRDTSHVTSEEVPQITNTAQIREAITRVAQTHPARGLDARVVLSLYLSETGQVVLVEARPTGDPDIDPYLTPIGHAMRFRPARLNGEPVPVWLSIPLHFTRR